jgi:small subunit ribosomal protein S29
LRGSTGAGISTLLLQSFSYALESSWLAIYIPRSINMVDSSSPYAYSEALQTYLQPEIARNLLEKVLSINGENLAKISVGGEVMTFEGGLKISGDATLTDAIQAGLQSSASPAATQQVLELVFKTIVQQKEIPVLMAIDGAQALFSTTLYRDPDYRQLQSYELAVPRLLHSCLRKSGPGSFGGIQRGKVLTAFSLQHKEWPISPELNAGLRLEHVDAYAKIDQVMLALLQDCRFSTLEIESALTLADLSREEGGRWNNFNDEYLMSKVVESGGNLGTFDRSLRRSAM